MKTYFVDRRAFWIVVGLYIAWKLVLLTVMSTSPQWLETLKPVDTGASVALAFTVGGRFADFGWPRWWGVLATFLIILILPLAGILAFMAAGGPSSYTTDDPLSVIPDVVGYGSTGLLALLLVWAGTRPGRPRPAA